MYRLIASDMDETFLGEGHRIPPANLWALERLRELGVLFVPASGRPYRSIMANFDAETQRQLEGSYVLSYNGACINRFGDPEPLSATMIDRGVVEELYAYARDRRQCLHVYTESGRIIVQFPTPLEHEILDTVAGVEFIDDTTDALALAGDEPLAKFLLMDVDYEAIQRQGARLMERLDPRKVAVTYSSRRYAEFVPAGVDKGSGLVRLAGLIGVPIEETIAVGDAANDSAMIRAAGLGVGVANVTPDVAPLCDRVLASTCDDGAIAEIVRTIIEPEHAA